MTQWQLEPVLIALGSNLPLDARTPATILQDALRLFSGEGLEIVERSRFFLTPCFPAGAGPDYVNAAVSVRPIPAYDANAVLAALHRMEAIFSRTREHRWGMRTLDLDLLAMGQLVLPDSGTQDRWRALPAGQQIERVPGELVLPHPRLQDRAFVLVPLAEVAPRWVHPRTGLTVEAMLKALPADDLAQVVPMA